MIGKMCNMKNIGEYSIEVQEILKRYDNERNKYRLKKKLIHSTSTVMFFVYNVGYKFGLSVC